MDTSIQKEKRGGGTSAVVFSAAGGGKDSFSLLKKKTGRHAQERGRAATREISVVFFWERGQCV